MTNTRAGEETIVGASGLRAIACLLVLLHHLAEKLATQNGQPIVHALHTTALNGSVGVSLFFALSGMLLSMPFWRAFAQGDALPSLREYAARRAIRIIPGYYAALAAASVAAIALGVTTPYMLERLIGGISFLGGFSHITLFPTEMNGPLWSIPFEVVCYVLMPIFMFIMMIMAPKGALAMAMVFWIGVLALTLGAHHAYQVYLQPQTNERGWQYGLIGGAALWMPNYNPIGMFAHFIFGILAGGAMTMVRNYPKVRARMTRSGVFDLLAAAALIGMVAAMAIWRTTAEALQAATDQPYLFPFFSLACLLAFVGLAFSQRIGRWLDNPFFQYTAKISFGIYIWHYFILEMLRLTIAPGLVYGGIEGVKAWFVFAIGITFGAYLAGDLSYRFIEEPAMRWRRNRLAARAQKSSPTDNTPRSVT